MDEGHNYPLSASAVNSDMYMHDLITGAADIYSAKQLKEQLIALFKGGGMQLHKWSSNYIEFLANSDPNDDFVLTPAHFLVGSSLTALPDPDLTEVPMNRSFGFHLVLVILTSRFEATRGLFWNGPRNFEPRSHDEDDFRTTPPPQPTPEGHLTNNI
ncbi:hypothetical protein AVEN_180490-1 [Araneus ventricosus]|uniref:Uncharacterized protein n=1 Tax=Araneus ventricosus TaxID=182803 RepID=A0A4Y2QC80_ARAVE|nr:hypothetical protein AVEN_180490-1 [Araneus ventricosus]